MAKKRMFSLNVLETDAFMDLPLSAQALYFHLNLRADDDGFIGNPKRITQNIGASLDDLKLLIAKRFVLTFDDGVIVIKHWRMHNAIKKDRYTETNFLDDLKLLRIKENGSYTFSETVPQIESGAQMEHERSTDGAQMSQTCSTDIGIGLGKGKNKDIYLDSIKEIVSYLNQVCGTKYRYQSEKTKEKIRARLNDGFTVDDFKAVIDRKFADWSGDEKMSKFLRPETLFGSKFEGYLNQKDAEPKPKRNAFNDNFEKRSYDFDELERRLLGG